MYGEVKIEVKVIRTVITIPSFGYMRFVIVLVQTELLFLNKQTLVIIIFDQFSKGDACIFVTDRCT